MWDHAFVKVVLQVVELQQTVVSIVFLVFFQRLLQQQTVKRVQQATRPMLKVPSVNPASPEVFPASKVNCARTVLRVSIVKVKKAIVVFLQTQQNVSNARQVGRQKLAVPSVNPARLELSAAS